MTKKVRFYEKLIPKYIPNGIVLFFFSIIALLSGSVKREVMEEHFAENERMLSDFGDNLFTMGRPIENQKKWEKIFFGSHKKSNMSYSGCGIIATYNALLFLGDRNTKITQLISYFEHKGAALKGGFGITPTGPYAFLKKRGYKVKKVTSRDRKALDRLGDNYLTFILTFYWNKNNISDQLHTVCISKEYGGFYIHNNYHLESDTGNYGRQGPYSTLSYAVKGVGDYATPLVTIGIK